MSEDKPKFPQGLSPMHYSIQLRDLFAMAALNALVDRDRILDGRYAAKMSYEYADAMLKEREKTHDQG
jgi:hypothetical protein